MPRARKDIRKWTRLTAREAELLRLAADEAGVSAAALIRALVLAGLRDAVAGMMADTTRAAG